MPSIYFHIPFCKQACHYCDFHFSTSTKYKSEILHAMAREIQIRKPLTTSNALQSIYFGGGTPSLLEADEIQRLLDRVSKYYEIAADAEITIEANPDDLNPQKVQALRQTPINRFSVGIQSFFEEDLRWMNRAHNAQEAEAAIKRIQDAGFENITADLIYGFPLLTNEKWKHNIQQLLQYQIPHISAYSMTVEPQTALDSFIKKGKSPAMNEGQSADQFELLVEELLHNGFEHYEISNFAKGGHYARHNSNYWKGDTYLGIGPSAHSFDGKNRSWNIANNAKYMQAVVQGQPFFETEQLSFSNRVNEYIMTSLRTMWGIDLNTANLKFGTDIVAHLLKNIQPFIENQVLILQDNHLILSSKGKLLADSIASTLFLDDED